MALSGLTNEVLRLLLAQNNLPISGTREQMIERLNTVDTSPPSSSRTRSADSNDASSNKRPRVDQDTAQNETDASDSNIQPRNDMIPVPDDDSNTDRTTISDPATLHQDGDRTGGVPRQDPLALASLISAIIDEKLKHTQPGPSSIPQHQSAPIVPQQPQQPLPQSTPTTRQQLCDPHFVSSLLSQPIQSQPTTAIQSSTQASLIAHVPLKTRQSILRGEYVEFDILLPENSCLGEGDLPGVSISFDGKQLSIPSPSRKRKTHIDSMDKWLSAFAVYCMILLANFPHRAVEMFSHQEIIRSAQRKFAGFAWLSYDIDFRRKAASNPTVNWGDRDIQLYLMKFTGQAKSSCHICGSGDHFAHGCSLSALRPTTSQRGTCHNFNRGTKCSQEPCPFSHRCRICNGDHPSYRHDDPTPKARSQSDRKPSNR